VIKISFYKVIYLLIIGCLLLAGCGLQSKQQDTSEELFSDQLSQSVVTIIEEESEPSEPDVETQDIEPNPDDKKMEYELRAESSDGRYGIYVKFPVVLGLDTLFLYDRESGEYRKTPIELPCELTTIFGHDDLIVAALSSHIGVYDPVTLEPVDMTFDFIHLKTSLDEGQYEQTIINGVGYDPETELYIFSYIIQDTRETYNADYECPINLRIFNTDGQFIRETSTDLMMKPAIKHEWIRLFLTPIDNDQVMIERHAGSPGGYLGTIVY